MWGPLECMGPFKVYGAFYIYIKVYLTRYHLRTDVASYVPISLSITGVWVYGAL